MVTIPVGGLAIVLVIWCSLIAAVARLAVARGRNPYGWGIGTAAASLLGIAAGTQLSSRVLANADLGDTIALTIGAVSLPVLCAFVPAAILYLVLRREPIKVAARDLWRVHFIDRGPGTVRFDGAIVRFEWEGGSESASRAELTRAEPDGECVRIRAGDRELALLPLGTPETPEGRRQQARALASRLRG